MLTASLQESRNCAIFDCCLPIPLREQAASLVALAQSKGIAGAVQLYPAWDALIAGVLGMLVERHTCQGLKAVAGGQSSHAGATGCTDDAPLAL